MQVPFGPAPGVEPGTRERDNPDEGLSARERKDSPRFPQPYPWRGAGQDADTGRHWGLLNGVRAVLLLALVFYVFSFTPPDAI